MTMVIAETILAVAAAFPAPARRDESGRKAPGRRTTTPRPAPAAAGLRYYRLNPAGYDPHSPMPAQLALPPGNDS